MLSRKHAKGMALDDHSRFVSLVLETNHATAHPTLNANRSFVQPLSANMICTPSGLKLCCSSILASNAISIVLHVLGVSPKSSLDLFGGGLAEQLGLLQLHFFAAATNGAKCSA
jgi:hypothetical protein